MPTRPVPTRARWLAAVAASVLVVAACGNDDAAEVADDPPPVEAPDDTGDPDGTEDLDTGPEIPPHLTGVGPDAWVEVASAPTALTEVDAAALDGELWVVGGLAEGGAVVDLVQVYDPATDTWREGPALPEPLHHTALVATDDTLVVLGGYRTLAFDPVADVWVLDEDRAGWSPGPALPEVRGAGAADFDGSRIVYGGGIGPDGLAAQVWALEGLDGDWFELGSLSVARDHLDATSDRAGTVWFLAGREEALTRNLGTVDVVRGDEVALLGELPTPRGGVAAFFVEAHGACLSGGETPESTFEEVECIDADGEVTVLPPLAQARHGHGADVIDGTVYVALGGPEPMLAVSASVEALRP